mmetsp:Transcript_47849/g.84231  ORF Transcript_47849/g.84231 Transcript_47849/m.84231 type:complete len:277 (-) Transcript_47849:52-882(-)
MARILKLTLISLVHTSVISAFEHGAETEATADALAVSMMEGLDANKDGLISVDELTHTLALAKHEEGDDADTTREWHNWLTGFNKADANQDLHLNTKELAYLLKHVSKQEGQQLFDDSLESVMKGYDTDKDGKISFKEVMRKSDALNQGDMGMLRELRKAFVAADKDKDKLLNAQELAFLLKHVSKEEAEAIFNPLEPIMNKFDTDEDGKMSVDELTTMLALGMEQAGEDKETKRELKHWLDGFKDADADKDLHLNMEELAYLLSHASKFVKGEEL